MSTMVRRLAMFRRLPRIRFKYSPQPLLSAEVASRFPQFQEDFAFLACHLFPVYARLDAQAAHGQNRARMLGCTQLVATTLLTICASTRLVLHGTLATGLQMIGVVLGIGVGVLNQVEQTSTDHTRYIQARRAAERLRALSFPYLSKQGAYADEQTRQRVLRQQILEIEKGARLNG